MRTGATAHYLKLSPADVPSSHDVAAEAERLRWVGTRLPVPEVVDVGRSGGTTWMLTREVPGTPASDRRWLLDPRRTARLMGEATRRFHDALADTVDLCPFSWRLADRLRPAELPQAQPTVIAGAPAELDLVVVHGDLCAPNVLLNDDGELGGFVDLGTLGVADRAADLGSQLWSLEHNGMGDVAGQLLDAYGYRGDVGKVHWYRDFYARPA